MLPKLNFSFWAQALPYLCLLASCDGKHAPDAQQICRFSIVISRQSLGLWRELSKMLIAQA